MDATQSCCKGYRDAVKVSLRDVVFVEKCLCNSHYKKPKNLVTHMSFFSTRSNEFGHTKEAHKVTLRNKDNT